MSDGTLIYAVVSGEYSDEVIHCLFEREEDAVEYLRRLTGEELKPSKWDSEYLVIEGFWHYYDKPGDDYDLEWTTTDWRIETYDYWPAGLVPAVERKAVRTS